MNRKEKQLGVLLLVLATIVLTGFFWHEVTRIAVLAVLAHMGYRFIFPKRSRRASRVPEWIAAGAAALAAVKHGRRPVVTPLDEARVATEHAKAEAILGKLELDRRHVKQQLEREYARGCADGAGIRGASS
jgi:thiol:disulfide interchange protein